MRTSSTPLPDGTLLVVSGPSGVGKSSVIDGVLERTHAVFSVSATTRAPRPGEIDGGYRYGTPRAPVVEVLGTGSHVILDIENDGAHQVQAAYPAAVLVFLMPPSREELERRLRSRGDTSDGDIQRRLAVADEQMIEARETYDHLVVNEDLESAISQVVSILEGPATPDRGSDAFPRAGDAATTRSNTE